MKNQNYRPRFLIILVIALVIGQVISINYLKQDFDNKLDQCYEAINMNAVLQGALVNILVEKEIMKRDDLLTEAQQLSTDLMDKYDEMKKLQMQNQDSPNPDDTTS